MMRFGSEYIVHRWQIYYKQISIVCFSARQDPGSEGYSDSFFVSDSEGGSPPPVVAPPEAKRESRLAYRPISTVGSKSTSIE